MSIVNQKFWAKERPDFEKSLKKVCLKFASAESFFVRKFWHYLFSQSCSKFRIIWVRKCANFTHFAKAGVSRYYVLIKEIFIVN